MTIDEAIKHCEEKAEEKRKDYERACAYNIPSEGCLECAEEHEQLAKWLKELKAYKERPQGEWNKTIYGFYTCSICDAYGNPNFFKFCPNCGAYMRKGGAE